MRKKTPDTSKLTRANAAPYTLRKTEASDNDLVVGKNDKTEAKTDAKTEAKAAPPADGETKVDAKALAASDGKVDSKFDDVKSGQVAVEATDGAPKPGDGPKSATHNEAPVEPLRARAETLAMPTVDSEIGAPPEIPAELKGTVEDPTNMPTSRNIPDGSPTDPALPPGHVPRGDSRSFRRGDEFALVYRQGSCVISRFGTVGQRGQWRVVDYPTSSSASNSYAKECSRFVAEGFSDYRD
ncbi:MAG: hypothetical protein M4D80_29265 [Myxococcota bacterium]|nr:hypothetical protein [Myxococcota bacterium]